jgi:hypothetical protein
MQQHWVRLMVAASIIAVLLLAACKQAQVTKHAEHPAEVKKIEGTELSRVSLSEKAMQRIDLKTDRVREQRCHVRHRRKVVPYGSLIYDPQGQVWIYTCPQPRTFVRQKVDVDYIEGDIAILKVGPPAGTVVASVGVAELYGTEFKVGH